MSILALWQDKSLCDWLQPQNCLVARVFLCRARERVSSVNVSPCPTPLSSAAAAERKRGLRVFAGARDRDALKNR